MLTFGVQLLHICPCIPRKKCLKNKAYIKMNIGYENMLSIMIIYIYMNIKHSINSKRCISVGAAATGNIFH